MPPRGKQPAGRDLPPPLPGGYKVGEKVFFTGRNETFDDGNTVVRGQQGEVTGPANAEGYIGIGMGVRFPGNTGNISCYPSEVRRLRAASPATPRLRPPSCSSLAQGDLPCCRCPNASRKRSRPRRSPTPSAGVWGGCAVRACGL